MNADAITNILLALFVSPLLAGVINRVKAIFAGRSGEPLLQSYYDIWKLLKKGSAISATTTGLFFVGPAISLSAIFIALWLIPFGSTRALIVFPGDLILFAYLLALARFFMVLAALDTGSSFEGMGASREVWFSAISEIPLFISLAALANVAGSFSLSMMYSGIAGTLWIRLGPSLIFAMISIFIVLLSENSRIPVDDPTTHLELTMIHEVMVLDHGGPDLAFITLGSTLKLWIFSVLLAGMIPIGCACNALVGKLYMLLFILLVAVMVGIVESTMARLKLNRVPQLLAVAGVLSLMSFAFSFFAG